MPHFHGDRYRCGRTGRRNSSRQRANRRPLICRPAAGPIALQFPGDCRERLWTTVNAIDLFALRGKNALVTGGSSGIGKQVAVAGRHQETLQEVAAEIAAEGGRAITVTCDVTEAEQVNAMLNRVTDELGGVDIAVCN